MDELLIILAECRTYEIFMNTYNNMIENGLTDNIPDKDKKEFYRVKNEIKKSLYSEYLQKYPDKIVRGFRELKYIYNASDIEINKLNEKFITSIKPVIEHYNLIERIKKLKQ